MKHVVINQVARAGSTCLKEIELGGKTLSTIATLPKVQNRNDVGLLFGKGPTEVDFDGVVLDLWNSHDLSKALFIGEGQRRLDNNEIAVTLEKVLMDEKAIIIDPNSEEYRYHRLYRVKKVRKGGESKDTKVTRLDLITTLSKFPSQVKEIFGSNAHDAAWRELDSRKLILLFTDWYIRYCLKFGASVILPPSPLVDGRRQSMLEVLKKVNIACNRVTVETTEAYPAIYVPIEASAFQNAKSPERIMDTIAELLQPHSILVLKFYRREDMLLDPIARKRLRDFLITVNLLKETLHDEVAVMVLDTREEGLAYFGNGVDLTCDPLGGVQDRPKFPRKKKQELQDSDDSEEDEELGRYGKWYHPDLREYLKVDHVREMLGEDGKLPHRCAFCDSIGDKLKREADDPMFPTGQYWNAGRRIHNFICRQEEDEIIRKTVRTGEKRAVELFLNRGIRANKNLLDLLP